MTQKITEEMVTHQLITLTELAREAGVPLPLYYSGNKTMGVTNKLVIGKTNVWADGMAGHTKREAYNAMRVMIAAFALSLTAKEESA